MELRYFRYFVAVADRKSFSRASEDLRVAQSAVSEQVKILEGELGVLLLNRDRRRVELTAAGEAFLGEARAVIQKAEQARELAQRAARGEVGRLKIGCFSSAVAEFLPSLIRRYRAERPDVQIELKELSPGEQLEALLSGEIHVAFTRRVASMQARGLLQERVYSDQVYLAMPESHPLAKNKELPLKAVAKEGFVFFERRGAPEFVDQTKLWCIQAGFAPRIVSEAPMMQTILMYVAAGLGISFVPGCIRSYRQSGVVFLPFTPRPPVFELVIARLKENRSPVVEAWLEMVRGEFPAIRGIFESFEGEPGCSKSRRL
jgi:DNA-binding transcriptional LysR family regulator